MLKKRKKTKTWESREGTKRKTMRQKQPQHLVPDKLGTRLLGAAKAVGKFLSGGGEGLVVASNTT